MIVSMLLSRQTRFNSQLNRVTHRCCSSPDSFERFDRSFIISIEHYYSSFQLPGLCSRPTVVAHSCFPETTVTVEARK